MPPPSTPSRMPQWRVCTNFWAAVSPVMHMNAVVFFNQHWCQSNLSIYTSMTLKHLHQCVCCNTSTGNLYTVHMMRWALCNTWLKNPVKKSSWNRQNTTDNIDNLSREHEQFTKTYIKNLNINITCTRMIYVNRHLHSIKNNHAVYMHLSKLSEYSLFQ